MVRLEFTFIFELSQQNIRLFLRPKRKRESEKFEDCGVN